MDDDAKRDSYLHGREEERDEERYESLAEAAGWFINISTGTYMRQVDRKGPINVWVEADTAYDACVYDRLLEA